MPTELIDNAPEAGIPYPPPFKYTDRASKARYVAAKYRSILTPSVLDVGCDQKQLAPLLAPGSTYVGVDLSDAADVRVDLDCEDLPFGDRSFETVVCCDVLEHLERAHAMFDELARVSASRLIISLPNPVRVFLLELFEGSGGRLKYYGLPGEAPKDRHRWFFGADDAERFVTERGRANGFEVEQLDWAENGCFYWLGRDGKDVLDHPNIQRGTMWCVLLRR